MEAGGDGRREGEGGERGGGGRGWKQTSFAHKSNNAGLIFYVEPDHVVSAIRLTVRPSRESGESSLAQEHMRVAAEQIH